MSLFLVIRNKKKFLRFNWPFDKFFISLLNNFSELTNSSKNLYNMRKSTVCTIYFPTFSMMLIDLSWSCWLWLELLQGLSVAVYSFADISLLLLLTCKRSSSPSPTEVAMELSKFTIMTGMMRTIFQTQCHSLYTKIESE